MTSRYVRDAAVEKTLSAAQRSPQNQILAKLPAGELALIMSHAEEVHCALRQDLFQEGETVKHVHFPLTAMCSLLVVLSGGTQIEAMTVGREGFVGLQLLNGVTSARYKGVCQIEGNYLVLKSEVFLSIIGQLPDLTRRLRRYPQFASEVLAQSAACNSVHTVRERCAKWLLITADATGSNEFRLTQEFLSQMLAVRRPGVTQALGDLVKRGLLSKGYGSINLVDIDGMKSAACEWRIIRRP